MVIKSAFRENYYLKKEFTNNALKSMCQPATYDNAIETTEFGGTSFFLHLRTFNIHQRGGQDKGEMEISVRQFPYKLISC